MWLLGILVGVAAFCLYVNRPHPMDERMDHEDYKEREDDTNW